MSFLVYYVIFTFIATPNPYPQSVLFFYINISLVFFSCFYSFIFKFFYSHSKMTLIVANLTSCNLLKITFKIYYSYLYKENLKCKLDFCKKN